MGEGWMLISLALNLSAGAKRALASLTNECEGGWIDAA